MSTSGPTWITRDAGLSLLRQVPSTSYVNSVIPVLSPSIHCEPVAIDKYADVNFVYKISTKGQKDLGTLEQIFF